MRLGLVEKGSYKTVEYDDLSGYRMYVNDFEYDFTRIIEETRRRFRQLWGVECPPDLIKNRLHFSEQRFFNRMVKSEQYGVFHRHTGANVCLGLLPEQQTYNLVIHELAHEVHYRQGGYNRADVYTQEMAAIMAEEEYEVRNFEFEPHFTSQQLLHQLKGQPGFARQSFMERWKIVTEISSITQISYLINTYMDENEGHPIRKWLSIHCPNPDHVRLVSNAMAAATECYAADNRRLVFNRVLNIGGRDALNGPQVDALCRSFNILKDLDKRYPSELLSNLINQAFKNW